LVGVEDVGLPCLVSASSSVSMQNAVVGQLHMRRFTRLTNAFSKKVENPALAVALFPTYYNFVRIHKTLRVTPAMAAGVSSKLWEMSDMVAILETWEAAQATK